MTFITIFKKKEDESQTQLSCTVLLLTVYKYVSIPLLSANVNIPNDAALEDGDGGAGNKREGLKWTFN